MIYTFRCDACGNHDEREQRVQADHTPPSCGACGVPMRREYNQSVIGDEIRSVSYFDPRKRHDVKGHGRYYDIGLGAWIGSKSERRRIMRAKGLTEVCPEDYHKDRDTAYQKYYRKVVQGEVTSHG